MADHIVSPVASISPIARARRGSGDYRKWQSAYRFATMNAAVFFIFSLINYAFGSVQNSIHFTVAVVFLLGSVVAFYRLCSAGGSLAAISFFVIGAGMAFGFGTAYSIYAHGYVFEFLFSEVDQVKNLPTINLMNSVSVLIVIACSRFLANIQERSTAQIGFSDILGRLQTFRVPAIALSGVYFAFFAWTFPVAENLLLRNVVGQLKIMPVLAVFLSFSIWGRLSATGKVMAALIATTMLGCGILETSKASALYPVLATVGGLYLGRYRRSATALLLVTGIFYFSILSPGTGRMRGHWDFDPARNTIFQRVQMMTDVLAGHSTSFQIEEGSAADQLIRFVHAPYQSYLINEWQGERPGNSLADAWTALIPRFLWPDKPIITRFASELYGRIYREGAPGTSGQAPTYTAEAYWNYGWPGVLVVSIMLGLELGWFTRKWLKFIHGRSSEFGIVVFAVPIAMYAIVVETWIGASYVGGFITLVVLVRAADLLMPFMGWTTMRARKRSGSRARVAT